MQTDPVIREPSPAELQRALHLLRGARVPAEARFLVAVKSRPFERFVAAAAWWSQEKTGRFQLGCLPGANRAEVGGVLLDQLAMVSRAEGMETLEHAELLSNDDDWLPIMRSRGFERMHSERSFEIAYRDAWTRVMRLHERHEAQIPAPWRTDPIRQHSPEAVLDIIAPHRLMPPGDVCSFWQSRSFSGFDLDLSCVLFDGSRAFGAFLLRRIGDLLYIDVQVVREPNPRLRSLGDLCVLYHPAQRVSPGGAIQRIQFRSGETEHRQTANLALRMGGRELSRRHVVAKKLTS